MAQGEKHLAFLLVAMLPISMLMQELRSFHVELCHFDGYIVWRCFQLERMSKMSEEIRSVVHHLLLEGLEVSVRNLATDDLQIPAVTMTDRHK